MKIFCETVSSGGVKETKIFGGLIKKIKTSQKKEITVCGKRVYFQRRGSLVPKRTHPEIPLSKQVSHFSAFTYGNAGDNILVKALQRSLDVVSGRENIYNEKHVHDEVDSTTLKEINQTRAVIVGGGGLFLQDTNPNKISGWQWLCSEKMMEAITVPLIVLAVGYNRFRGQDDFAPVFRENINKLVERSAFFGLRNSGSIRAIRNYLREDLRDKVAFHPCPTTILAKLYSMPEKKAERPFVAINCAFDRSEKRFASNKEKLLKEIAQVAKGLSADYAIKYYVHVETDKEILPVFEQEGVSCEVVVLEGLRDEQTFLDVYSSPSLVIGMRGHSQMIPFGCRTPILSIVSHEKMKWFLEDISHPEWGVDITEPDFGAALNMTARKILENPEIVTRQITESQEIFWQATKKNIAGLKL